MKKIFTSIIYCCLQTILFAQPGALDTTFANKGKFFANNDFPNNTVSEADYVSVQPDGKILTIGYGYNYDTYTNDFAIMRLNADGTPDNSFGNNGRSFVDFSIPDLSVSSSDYGYYLALQPDGKIVVAGVASDFYYNSSTNAYNYADMAIARLNTNGSLDSSFNGTGKKLIDLSAFTGNLPSTTVSIDEAFALVVKATGKIVMAGTTLINDGINPNHYTGVAVQLDAYGNLDTKFDTDGVAFFDEPDNEKIFYGVALQPDGKTLFSGYSYTLSTGYSNMAVLRLMGNGSPDKTFGTNGLALIDAGNPIQYGGTIVLQADNKILQGGRQYVPGDFAAFTLARLNTDGTLDHNFNGSGIQSYSKPGENNYGSLGLAVQKDGKIIQTGGNNSPLYYPYSGDDNVEVIRYNPDGSLDDGFGNHGRSIIDFGNWTDNAEDFGVSGAVQPDGKIVVAGYSIQYYGYNGIAAARLLAKGKSIALDAPGDQFAVAGAGECGASFNNIDPIITPSELHPKVYYQMYGATVDTGKGSVSGKQFNIGTTTVVYTLASNPLQRAIFKVTVEGGTPAGALDFDGIDDYVDLDYINPISSGNAGQFSFEAWIKVRAYNKGDDYTGSLIFGDERNYNGGIVVQLDSSGYISTFQPNVGWIVSSYKVPLHTWTHIAFVQSDTQLDLYVNGNFVQTLLTAPNLFYHDYDDFMLGAFTSDFVNYYRHFNGEMDEVRVWDRVICPAQIQNNLHCEIAGLQAGLVAYYKFNQGVASCSNILETSLYNEAYPIGSLRNFALKGSKSNWVEGHVSGYCGPFNSLAITSPGDITVYTNPGECTAIVNFAATATSDCSQNINITYSQDPGTPFPVGYNYVTAKATDGSGNYATTSFTVIVYDQTPPVLITKDTSIALDMNGNAYLDAYSIIKSVNDDCGLNYVYAYPSYFGCSDIGTHEVTVIAIDISGNQTSQTAYVTVTPFATTSFVTVSPAPVQYSDIATFTAGIIGAANFYNYGCGVPATDVTFKVGQLTLGTASLSSDFYGNLIATLDRQITKGFLDSLSSANNTTLNAADKQVTAIFSGGTTDAIQFKKKAVTQLPFGKEDALLEYVGAQVINTKNTEVAIPVSVRLTDMDDGYRGDITNASITFTIEPVTTGASILSADSKTTSDITFLNKDHTSGIAQEKFKVALGGNQIAKFKVTAKAGNLYKNQITVPVNVSTSANNTVTGAAIALSDLKLTGAFDVTAMPNPSYSYFSLSVKSPDKVEKLNIRVMDIAGRVIESKTGVTFGESIQLGKQYKAGTYLVEVRQGQNIKLLKLVKL